MAISSRLGWLIRVPLSRQVPVSQDRVVTREHPAFRLGLAVILAAYIAQFVLAALLPRREWELFWQVLKTGDRYAIYFVLSLATTIVALVYLTHRLARR
ncbi:MAG: hypothetical protein AAB650_01975 [Patescibacteria group bacterium]